MFPEDLAQQQLYSWSAESGLGWSFLKVSSLTAHPHPCTVRGSNLTLTWRDMFRHHHLPALQGLKIDTEALTLCIQTICWILLMESNSRSVEFFCFGLNKEFKLFLSAPLGAVVCVELSSLGSAADFGLDNLCSSPFLCVSTPVFGATEQTILSVNQNHPAGAAGEQGAAGGRLAESHRRLQKDRARGWGGPPMPPSSKRGPEQQW